VTNRCVRRYDHYCPIFHNAIGQRNQVAFVLFLAVYLVGQLLFAFIAVSVLHYDWQCWSSTSERLAMQVRRTPSTTPYDMRAPWHSMRRID
jgi:hypothetical protein